MASVEISKAQGSYLDPSQARTTVGELAIGWLANKEHALKPSSYSPIRTAWRVYAEPRWSATPVGSIRPSEVENWIRELGQGKAVTHRIRQYTGPRSPSVVLRAVGILAGILDIAVRDGRIPANPARGSTNLPRKTSQKPRRYLTNEEVFRFAQHAPDSTRGALILTLSYTGIRWGEAVALRVEDIDLERRRIMVLPDSARHEPLTTVMVADGAPGGWPRTAHTTRPQTHRCESRRQRRRQRQSSPTHARPQVGIYDARHLRGPLRGRPDQRGRTTQRSRPR